MQIETVSITSLLTIFQDQLVDVAESWIHIFIVSTASTWSSYVPESVPMRLYLYLLALGFYCCCDNQPICTAIAVALYLWVWVWVLTELVRAPMYISTWHTVDRFLLYRHTPHRERSSIYISMHSPHSHRPTVS